MVHAGKGWWFSRHHDGSVHVRKTNGGWVGQMEVEAVFSAEEWGKVLAETSSLLRALGEQHIHEVSPAAVAAVLPPPTMTATVSEGTVVEVEPLETMPVFKRSKRK